MKNSFIASAIGAVASIAVLSGSERTPGGTEATPSAASAPCGPILSLPRDTVLPAAPTNLRISGQGQQDELELSASEDSTSGPFVSSAEESETSEAALATHPYFDLLVARPDCQMAYTLRSQQELDGIKTSGVSPAKYPVTYDSVMDAALFWIDPSAAAGSGLGSTDSQQKRPLISTNGTSMLMTWDFRFDEGFRYQGDGYLAQHKTWRINADNNVMWLTFKTSYDRAAKAGNGLAEVIMTAQNGAWNAPGTTSGGAEILLPRVTPFYFQANTWTRIWLLVEGRIGGGVGGEVVYLSTWAADENRDPIRLYDRLPYYTPIGGLVDLWFEYDTSQDTARNGSMRSWNRNLAVLKGVTLTGAQSLLQRPSR